MTKYIICPKCNKRGVYISGEKVACKECGYADTIGNIVKERLEL